MNNNLFQQLKLMTDDNKSIKIGIIGIGKFSTMFLSQARVTKGFKILALADLKYSNVENALKKSGYSNTSEILVNSLNEADSDNKIWFTDDGGELSSSDQLDIIIEATGNVEAAVIHAINAFNANSHVIMVTVEADALCGKALYKKSLSAGVVYSMAYGDQPAIICEMVDQLRSSGMEIVCAGKGTKYLPEYHDSTPDTALALHGYSDEVAEKGGLNPKMFNAFIDGTKSSIEMAAVANATGIQVQPNGLYFPPAGSSLLPQILKSKELGGILDQEGVVEVVSSLKRNGEEIKDHIRFGVFVVFKANSNYVANCFHEYGMTTDSSGLYSCLWRPFHLIGLELGYSVAKCFFDKKATGASRFFNGDVVAVAKKNLKVGDMLDGEGGKTVWGKLMPAQKSIDHKAIPIGLSNKIKIIKDVQKGNTITEEHVEKLDDTLALQLRKEILINSN